ncbi:hypothetical protein M5689_008271 [Euphorbia peplus]|nr:hypothetical protein M5689_008271 [Euphorbia peplus]
MAAARENIGGESTVPELIKHLKTVVQEAEALLTREDELKREIEAKKNEFESLHKHFKIERSRLVKWREMTFLYWKQRDKLRNRLKEKDDDQREIIELECEKLKAEADADVYRKRLKELEGRLLIRSLEEEEEFVDIITAEENTGEKELSDDEDFVLKRVTSDGSEHGDHDGDNDFVSFDSKAKRPRTDLSMALPKTTNPRTTEDESCSGSYCYTGWDVEKL